jgi:hypothetical protein
MKKVTDGQRYWRHHFGQVSFGPFEAKLIVAACRDASVIRGIFPVRNVRTRKIQNFPKMMTTIPLPICNLFHLWVNYMRMRRFGIPKFAEISSLRFTLLRSRLNKSPKP